MKHWSIAITILILGNNCFATVDCENADKNDDLIYCSKQILNESERNLNAALKKLATSTWIPKVSANVLIAHYKNSSALSKKICESIFKDGGLRNMYVYDCMSTQIDKLIESINAYICTQQDSDGCS